MRPFFTSLAAIGHLRRKPAQIIVVVAGPNPSFDYYLAPRLAGPIPAQVIDISAAPSGLAARDLLANAFILFCRYTSSSWLRAVEASADSIAGVGLFIDDDIDALASEQPIPLSYRLRLLRLHLIHRRRLARCCDLLFVATPVLETRYETAQPFLMTPVASEDDMPVPGVVADGIRVAFHATSVHTAEHRWLKPVVRNILAAEPAMSFEVRAGAPLSWRWRGMPRTAVLPPLPWPQYRAETRVRGADLLLAPLLPSASNAARSWTKRIDAMRLGAALLISDPDIYHSSAEEQALGMCVPMHPAAWRDAICSLVRDRGRLERLRDLNRENVLRASAAAEPLLAAIEPSL